jgi:DUF4097 and DUF4098 domain-containing protein YvlB
MTTHRLFTALCTLALVAATAAPTAASVIWGSAGTPGWYWDDQNQIEKSSKTFTLAKGGSVDISNVSGDIKVTGGAGDQVIIDAVKRGRTEEDLKAVQIQIQATAARVEVRTEYERGRRNVSASVNYTVTVPKDAIVELHSVSGDITVANIGGELRAETVSGDATIAGATALALVKSVSGDVVVQDSSSADDVVIGSVSGNVTLKAVKARGVDANSISGDVIFTDVTSERVKANSISGDITFGGPLAKGGRYALQSHSGEITVYASDKSGFELTASSFSGSITNGITLTTEDISGGDAERHGPRRQTLKGRLGDSSAVLQLNSFSGDIRIVKR